MYQFCSYSEGFQSKMTSNMSCIAHSNECIESPVSWLEQQLNKSQMAPKHDLRVSKSNGFVSTQEIIRGTRDLAPFGKIHLFVHPKLLEHPTPNRGRNPTIDAMPHLRNWSNLGRSSSILKAKKRYLICHLVWNWPGWRKHGSRWVVSSFSTRIEGGFNGVIADLVWSSVGPNSSPCF